MTYIAHSYGGVIATNLGVNWKKYDIPEPAAMLLAPGSGPFKGARLPSYDGLSSDLKLIVVVGEDDYVVGDEFAKRVLKRPSIPKSEPGCPAPRYHGASSLVARNALRAVRLRPGL